MAYEKNVRVYINQRMYWPVSPVAYRTVVNLADMEGTPTMTYRDERKQIAVLPGETVEIEDGGIFNVAHTDKA
jgi:hypothetical protein